MICWVLGHSCCGQTSALVNSTQLRSLWENFIHFKFLCPSAHRRGISIEEKCKERYVQLFPSSPSPLPALTGTGPGGLILAVPWTWFAALPPSLAAHPPPPDLQQDTRFSSPCRGQQHCRAVLRVQKQTNRADEPKRRQNFILFQWWRGMDLASNTTVLARKLFCWHILLCQISTSKRQQNSEILVKSVPGSHQFETTLICC